METFGLRPEDNKATGARLLRPLGLVWEFMISPRISASMAAPIQQTLKKKFTVVILFFFFFFLLLFIFIFWLCLAACEILVPNQELNLCPLHRKC